MTALVQYPQQSSTVTMLQTRPSSASGILPNPGQGQVHNQYSSSAAQMHLAGYHGIAGAGQTTYRGQTSMAPGAPYSFTPTLPVSSLRPSTGPYQATDLRASSAPVLPTFKPFDAGQIINRSRYPAAASVSTSSTSSSDLSSGTHQSVTRDDLAITSTASIATRPSRPFSTVNTAAPVASSTTTNSPTTAKAAPDRYRRPVPRRAESAGQATNQMPSTFNPVLLPNTGMLNNNQVYPQIGQFTHSQSAGGYQPFTQAPHFSSSNNTRVTPFNPNISSRAAADDMHLRKLPAREEAARYRRRSIHTIDMGDTADAQLRGIVPQVQRQGAVQEHLHPLRSSPVTSNRPSSSPSRSGKAEPIQYVHNNQKQPSPAAKRESSVLIAIANPAPLASAAAEETHTKYDQPQLVNIPPRSSSSDAAKRIINPSPLSKPMAMSNESPVSKDSFASTVSAALQAPAKATYAQVAQGVRPQSPAVKQLAALNDKEGKKKSSRLRRAFSFGSAAELRKAAENHDAKNTNSGDGADRARLRKERYQDEREAEQARIAQQQEEAGIGQSIYSGQGNIFSGSTDNLSISSTASSASIMIRKMGQGMKKSTRSLVGLFRPKSVIGVPPASSAVPQPSEAQVSMINIEAERERVNVNANPHDQVGGGTGFPKLERNSIDAAGNVAAVATDERTSSSDSNTQVRKSIIGGEKERAEVLSAVKRGILKRSATDSPNSSPIVRPDDNRAPNFNLPTIPHVNDSPSSSAPSTPNDDAHGHKRTNSVTIGGEDYFMSALKFRGGDSKSVPNTPPSGIKRNATFSPRIQFHDTWPSGEYDRRGEIATCNRLTPMLAQQIKEELNTFKMEMEVHENSKIYTHFF